MGKYLGFIGGFLAFVGIIASLFIGYLAWYNNGTVWVSAIGGGEGNIFLSFTDHIMEYLPGIIALLGAILCFVPRKLTCLIGGLLVLIGVGLFVFGLYNLYGNFSFFWVSSTVHFGYGAMITTLGGIIGFIGTFVGEE